VYLVIVFLSMILPMLLLSSKLKRNLIIAQNLTSFSINASCHLLPTRQVLNHATREDIYRLYTQITWPSPLVNLGPSYTCRYWLHSLKIPLGQLWVGSHVIVITSCRLGKARPNHQVATTLGHYTQCHLDVGPTLQG
jgi:hypothetical protein